MKEKVRHRSARQRRKPIRREGKMRLSQLLVKSPNEEGGGRKEEKSEQGKGLGRGKRLTGRRGVVV